MLFHKFIFYLRSMKKINRKFIIYSLIVVGIICIIIVIGNSHCSSKSSKPKAEYVRTDPNKSASGIDTRTERTNQKELSDCITADAAIVYNASTGNAIFEKNADRREYPASMTKMMTGILAIESGKINDEITISKAASDASYTFLKTGDKLTMSELLYMLMLSSNNGAAVALAEYLSTPGENFAAKMNKKARAIGMMDTHFITPNGMHHNDHYSTARDMAKLGAYCMRNPQFKVYVDTEQHRARWKVPAGKHYACYNENKLLSLYDGVNGIKTGYTEPAQCCLATSYEKNGKHLVVVVMHSKRGQFKYHDTTKLLDWAIRRI